MIPIVTPAEMAAIDEAAPEPVDVLIARAGAAVAWAARRLLGGVYGRRIAVLAGPGNNGADGRVAGERLQAWGARVFVAAPDVASLPANADLVIDAAYGTGLSREYTPPTTAAPVLAVDVPSGVAGLTGELVGRPFTAQRTVTFQALKPGLVLEPGATRCGLVEVADIGLDASGARSHLVERADVARVLPLRDVAAHKWRSACWVVGGSAGMDGAAVMAAAAAARTGAGYVRLSVPGAEVSGPLEVVGHAVGASTWADELTDTERFGSIVLGPGLGRTPEALREVAETLARVDRPVVVDGDGLVALAARPEVVLDRSAPTVLTPHDGEFERLVGRRPGADRFDEARLLARELRSVVLLKGPATVVAAPDGEVQVVNNGDARLATAGTGDVLAGIIGSLLAQGAGPFEAAAGGAWLHGHAASLCPRYGMVASDLLDVLPEALHETHMG